MIASRVWIHLKPRLYKDLFIELLKSCGLTEILEIPFLRADPLDNLAIDVVVLSLDECGDPALRPFYDSLPQAKLLAFSPTGECGLRRMPGEEKWEEIRPFGLDQIMAEMQAVTP